MLPIEMPDQTGWDGEIHHVCFNDECEYYKKSWGVLRRQGGYQTGYRCRLSPRGSYEAQLVWGPDALKDKIREYKFIKDVFGSEPDTLTPLVALALDLPDDWHLPPGDPKTPLRLEEIRMSQGQYDGGVTFAFEDGSMVGFTHDCRIRFFDSEDDRPSVDIPAGELVEWLRSKK
jgi:hypothetical protein